MKTQGTINKVGDTVRLFIIASVAGMWMLLLGLLVQALGPGTLAHDIETVLATHSAPAKVVATGAIASASRSSTY